MRELEELLQIGQPNIVLRMIFVHTVTILDSFLMYSARALLNHPPHLQRFLRNAKALIRKDERKVLLNRNLVEQNPDVDTPEQAYIWRAQALIAKMTFQSHKAISRYFSAMLVTPHNWAAEQMQVMKDTRNDLVHRNGITPNHVEVQIWPNCVKDIIRIIFDFIDTAAATLLQEDARYRTDDDTF